MNHQILGKEIVQAVQTQMQTGRNLMTYVNDSDLIGTHSRLPAVNLTDFIGQVQM